MPFNIDRETKKPLKETYINSFFDPLWACATATGVVHSFLYSTNFSFFINQTSIFKFKKYLCPIAQT